jgi:hypothetical protein
MWQRAAIPPIRFILTAQCYSQSNTNHYVIIICRPTFRFESLSLCLHKSILRNVILFIKPRHEGVERIWWLMSMSVWPRRRTVLNILWSPILPLVFPRIWGWMGNKQGNSWSVERPAVLLFEEYFRRTLWPDFIAPNGRMAEELERIWNKESVAWSTYCPGTCLEILRTTIFQSI